MICGMNSTKETMQTRPASNAVKLRDDVYRRLVEYRNNQRVRSILTDLVSVAVERYLDEQEGK